MADTTPRVVILGAAGEAQQQLLTALNELGAKTLAVGDFDQLDPDSLAQLVAWIEAGAPGPD